MSVELSARSDERITDDVVACLRVVLPLWLGLFPDDSALTLHVRDTLDQLESDARKTGFASTGCMVVTYDAEVERLEWSIVVGYRYDAEGNG